MTGHILRRLIDKVHLFVRDPAQKRLLTNKINRNHETFFPMFVYFVCFVVKKQLFNHEIHEIHENEKDTLQGRSLRHSGGCV